MYQQIVELAGVDHAGHFILRRNESTVLVEVSAPSIDELESKIARIENRINDRSDVLFISGGSVEVEIPKTGVNTPFYVKEALHVLGNSGLHLESSADSYIVSGSKTSAMHAADLVRDLENTVWSVPEFMYAGRLDEKTILSNVCTYIQRNTLLDFGDLCFSDFTIGISVAGNTVTARVTCPTQPTFTPSVIEFIGKCLVKGENGNRCRDMQHKSPTDIVSCIRNNDHYLSMKDINDSMAFELFAELIDDALYFEEGAEDEDDEDIAY